MRYRSSDGLMTSTTADAYVIYERLLSERRGQAVEWKAILRECGVKMAHPDDGWVTEPARIHGSMKGQGPGRVHPSYPLFEDRVEVGDLIALGYQYDSYLDCGRGHRANYRLMRVTRVERNKGILIPMTYYHYEPTGEVLPPRPKSRTGGLLRRRNRS